MSWYHWTAVTSCFMAQNWSFSLHFMKLWRQRRRDCNVAVTLPAFFGREKGSIPLNSVRFLMLLECHTFLIFQSTVGQTSTSNRRKKSQQITRLLGLTIPFVSGDLGAGHRQATWHRPAKQRGEESCRRSGPDVSTRDADAVYSSRDHMKPNISKYISFYEFNSRLFIALSL